jgi:hypothetical protein
VVIFGALLSMGMALLSIAGIKNKKESIVKYEKVAVEKTIRVEKRVIGTITSIIMVMNK